MDPEGRWLLEGMQQTSARVIRVQNVAHHRVTIPVLAPGELDQVGFGECFRIGVASENPFHLTRGQQRIRS